MKRDSIFWTAISALFFAFLCVTLTYCGKVDDTTDNACTPKPLADLSAAYYIAKGPGAPIPGSVQIGKPLEDGLEASWSPSVGLSDPDIAQPIASPDKTTVYYRTVRSPKCGTEAKSAVTVYVLTEKLSAEDMFVTIDGVKYPTGYNKLYDFASHYRATYLHMGTGYYGAIHTAPDVIDLTPPDFHVNQQPQGSCWAEGGRSCGEATYYYVKKVHEWISTQRIIDCSGRGSAGGGGDISIDDFVDFGLVREKDYPYNGHDNRCKKDVQPFFKANKTFFLRSASGGRPKLDDLRQAHDSFGASEDCGSAGALGNGGYNKRAGGGGTNHCWGGFGIKKHPTEGYYCRLMQNSWGTGWGGGKDLHGGQGCYGFADDGSVVGNIMDEIKFVDMGSPCPVPHIDPGADQTIVLMPGLPDTAEVGVDDISSDQVYQWSVLSGDMKAIIYSPNSSKTRVKVSKTTRLQLLVKNACAEAHAEVTIHVWKKADSGVLTEDR